ncbi:maltase A1-like [Portunus trituberculatus]|uniref:maltase A1-like n=1 Tax=Portunus trituberculatus TaxID=210409 RepID=UPI001E1CCEB0|nr:maltase A1-like [Portunus trituberculatus]
MRRSYMFGGAFVVLFIAIIVIIVVCVSSKNGWKKQNPDEPEFWEKGAVYQVYPRSFSDSDKDGTGDLMGVVDHLDYLKELGVVTVWISPIFESPMKDFGYDISNYTTIDRIFGTMNDFEVLVTETHRNGLKLVLDFVPNHTSNQHEWFIKSESKEGNYTDYYVWAEAKGFDENNTAIPPNNWMSEFGGSAWEWSDTRGEFYYHQFLVEQPDLNYRSEHVKEEMKVSGRSKIRKKKNQSCILEDMLSNIQSQKYISRQRLLPFCKIIVSFALQDLGIDEPTDSDNPALLQHIFTTNQPETFQVLREWRELVDKYHEKVLMVEVYSEVEDVMRYYGNDSVSLAHFPFNFFMLEALNNRSTLTGYDIKDTISLWLDNMPEGKWPNWVLGNHDNGRVASRLGKDMVDALNMVVLLLPGTPLTYNGEEIGMEDTFISWEDTKDPEGCRWGRDHYQEHSRDPERTPMQWNGGYMAGFTNGDNTWLPINPDYEEINVALQKNATHSHLKFYQHVTKIRQEETFKKGEITFPTYDDSTFSFIRSLEGYPSYLAVVNIATVNRTVNMHLGANFPLPNEGEIVICSSTSEAKETPNGSMVSLDSLALMAGEGILLKLPEK